MRDPGNKVDSALQEEVCSQDRNISAGEAEERRTGSGSRVEDITPPPPAPATFISPLFPPPPASPSLPSRTCSLQNVLPFREKI